MRTCTFLCLLILAMGTSLGCSLIVEDKLDGLGEPDGGGPLDGSHTQPDAQSDGGGSLSDAGDASVDAFVSECEEKTDGASCGDGGSCRDGKCAAPGCGNGFVDDDEECDDGNDVGGDGCEADCEWTCEEHSDCTDNNVCNGQERCDPASHTCKSGSRLDCSDDGNACTVLCHPVHGCNTLIDKDGDNQAPSSLGACGKDCDDSDKSVYSGAPELCGDNKDNNCDGHKEPDTRVWYIDCDGDGFAGSEEGAVKDCHEPEATRCGGGWTTLEPSRRISTDCFDFDDAVHPEQTRYFREPSAFKDRPFDYNCDGEEEPFHQTTGLRRDTRCNANCSGPNGWLGDKLPYCGDTGEGYSFCFRALGGVYCDRDVSSKKVVQLCR